MENKIFRFFMFISFLTAWGTSCIAIAGEVVGTISDMSAKADIVVVASVKAFANWGRKDLMKQAKALMKPGKKVRARPASSPGWPDPNNPLELLEAHTIWEIQLDVQQVLNGNANKKDVIVIGKRPKADKNKPDKGVHTLGQLNIQYLRNNSSPGLDLKPRKKNKPKYIFYLKKLDKKSKAKLLDGKEYQRIFRFGTKKKLQKPFQLGKHYYRLLNDNGYYEQRPKK